jgi:hypothetical protein
VFHIELAEIVQGNPYVRRSDVGPRVTHVVGIVIVNLRGGLGQHTLLGIVVGLMWGLGQHFTGYCCWLMWGLG